MGRKRKKKTKYEKTHMSLFKCNNCSFEWAYETMKCPVCYSDKLTQKL